MKALERRLPRPTVKKTENLEMDVIDGDVVDVWRVRWDRDAGERRKETHNAGHGAPGRLVDDLADLIDNADAPTQD